MPDGYLITGAGAGFGALSARALATAGNIVYAGMYSHTGDFSKYDADAKAYAKEHSVNLRTVPLDLSKQDSPSAAVRYILDQAGRLDAVVHNAGYMNYGPSEAFTPEQYLSLYGTNVMGTQRLNLAVVPYMRSQRKDHLIWISSTSVYGAKGPWLGG